ncbi:MAG: hypothetical protein ACPGR2_13700 [Psychrobium sp.]
MDDKRSEYQKTSDANKKQKQLESTTKSFNKQKDINEKIAQSEKEKAIRESNKESDLTKKLKQVSKNINTNNIQNLRARKIISNFKNRKSIDSTFNSKMSELFTKKQIAVNKETTARMNIMHIKAKSRGKNSLNSLRTTMRHMLRIKGYKRQTEEWISSQSHLNLYFHNDEYYTHDEFLEIQNEVYESIINDKEKDIKNRADKRNKKDVKKYSDLRNSYKRKILDIAKDDKKLTDLIKKLESGDPREVNSQNEVINKYITAARNRAREIVKNSDMPDGRKLQKYKNIDTWIKHRDTHIKKKNYQRVCHSERENVVSEVSLKIPHANGNLGISQREYLDSVKTFFENKPFLNSHNILVGCVHFDESKQTDLAENEVTGANVHLVVDCKNNKTNRYSWRKSMIDFARSQQDELNKQFNMNFDINSKGYDLTEKEICHVGQLLQLSFYKHIQLDLFIKKNIKLKFVSEEDRNESTYILACLEQELAIQDRISSRFNMQNEELIKNKKELDNIKQEMDEHKAELVESNKALEEANKKIEQLKEQLSEKQERKQELNDDVVGLIKDKTQLKSDVDNLENKRLEQALKRIEEWQNHIKNDDSSSDFGTLKAKAAASAINSLSEAQPEIAEKVAQSAVTFENQKQIEEHLKVSNNLNNNKNLKSKSKFKK